MIDMRAIKTEKTLNEIPLDEYKVITYRAKVNY